MAYAPETALSPQRMMAIAVVVLLHVGLIYALKSGLARKAVELVTGPMEVNIVKEEIIPEREPPPPPVKIETPPPFVPPPEIAIEYPSEPVNTIITTQTPPPEPTPPPRAQPVARTAPSVNPRGMSRPEYPPIARRLGQEGTVRLLLYVLENGRVGDAKIEKSSGHSKLDEAAQSHAIRHWRMKPGTENGKPIAMWYPFNVVFRLDDYR